MCNSKRTPRTQALRQGCPTTSTGFLAGTQAHFKCDSATEHVSVPFQLTFPEKRAGFPVPCRHIQQHSALLLPEPPSQSPPPRLWLQSQSTSHQGSFLPCRNSPSQGKASPFPWIQLWAARCGCSCTHCFEQDRDQTTLKSRPEQAFAIYKLII